MLPSTGWARRAGNASLEEVVMALQVIYKYKTGINSRLLYSTSRMVSTLTGIAVQVNKALVGENAFAHESGIHTRGVTEKPLTFEPIDPALVGRTRKLVAGKLAGTRGIKAELEEVGIHPTEEQLKEIVQRVKELGDKGKMVTDADLLALTSAVMGEVSGKKKSFPYATWQLSQASKLSPQPQCGWSWMGKNTLPRRQV